LIKPPSTVTLAVWQNATQHLVAHSPPTPAKFDGGSCMEQLGSANLQGSVDNDCEGDRTEQDSRRFVIAYDVETRQFVEATAPHPNNAPPRVHASPNLKRRIDAVLINRSKYEENGVKRARCGDVPGCGVESPRSDDISNAPVVRGAAISRDSEESLLFAALLLCNFGSEHAADSSPDGEEDDSAVEETELGHDVEDGIPEEAQALPVVATAASPVTTETTADLCYSQEGTVHENGAKQPDRDGSSYVEEAGPDTGSGANAGADAGDDAGADAETGPKVGTGFAVQPGVLVSGNEEASSDAAVEPPHAAESFLQVCISASDVSVGEATLSSIDDEASSGRGALEGPAPEVPAAARADHPRHSCGDNSAALHCPQPRALIAQSAPDARNVPALCAELMIPAPSPQLASRALPASHGKPYTAQEVARIRASYSTFLQSDPPVPLRSLMKSLSAELGRSNRAIKGKLWQLRLTDNYDTARTPEVVRLPSASMVEAREQAAAAPLSFSASWYLLAHESCVASQHWVQGFIRAADDAVREGNLSTEAAAQLISQRTGRSAEASTKLLQDLAHVRERQSELQAALHK
jgi:hypothetical protein